MVLVDSPSLFGFGRSRGHIFHRHNQLLIMSLWKSSALAPFYHGLEELEGNELENSSIMETAAEREDVRLRYSEANGRFMLQRQ